jgi:hypothetical protein
MNEPKLAPGEWIGIGGLAITVMGTVVGGVKAMLGSRDTRLADLEKGHQAQALNLVALQTCQENTAQRLGEIHAGTTQTNMKLDAVLTALVNRQPGGRRSTDD